MLYIINIDDCNFSMYGDTIGVAGLKVLSKKHIAAKSYEPVYNEAQGRITIYNMTNKKRVLDNFVVSQINLGGVVYATAQELVMALNNMMAQCCCDDGVVTTTEEVTTTTEEVTTTTKVTTTLEATTTSEITTTSESTTTSDEIPEGALTFEGDTDTLTFEGDTDYITFETELI